jgi:hypothetical protein
MIGGSQRWACDPKVSHAFGFRRATGITVVLDRPVPAKITGSAQVRDYTVERHREFRRHRLSRESWRNE